MLRIIDILFIIGILTNLLKGSELILRPHQKIYLQETFSSLTLWLDYKKPLKWYKYITSPTGQIFLTIICVSTVIVERVYFYAKPKITPIYYPSLYWTLSIISLTYVIVFIFFYSRRATRFLLNGDGYVSLIAKYSLIIILTFIYSILYIVLLFPIAGIQNEYLTIFAIIALFLIAAPIGVFLGYLFILGTILLITAFFLLVLETLLKICRAIAWRIIEYNGGVFAALILIFTILLGIIEIVLRSR